MKKYHGFSPACVTGKPVELYGAEGREEATGRGVGILAFKMLRRLGRTPQATRVAIQGFGNVGVHAAKFLHEAEFKIVAISDVSGGYYDQNGIAIPHAIRHVNENHALEGLKGATPISNEALLQLDVDLLIPAAIGGVIHGENADQVQASIIIEAANAPITPEADLKLTKRGVITLPDIIANAGGVTVSYFEWVQNLQHYKWGLNRIRQELDQILTAAFESVWQRTQELDVTLRVAAYMIAIERVAQATRLAGY